MKPKFFDFIFIILAVFICSFFIFKLKNSTGSKNYLYVTTPEGEFIYPLEQDNTYTFDGIIGESVIIVKDNHAYFESSSCPNKTCVSSPAISRNNEWTSCLPNGIFIKIQGKEDELDAVSM